MILVTLGTQDKNFIRLLDIIQREIDNGNIKDKVVVQAGCTKYESKDMEILDLSDREMFEKLISECSILITHGGVGSILTGLRNNKKVIVCPRLAKYNEHVNDHQIELADKLEKLGYLLVYHDGDQIKEVFNRAKQFKVKPYRLKGELVELVDERIEAYIR